MWGTEEQQRVEMHRWAWASSKGQPRKGKAHPTTKGAIVFTSRSPPLKHKTEFLLCPLGSISISFWKGTGNTFKEKKKCFLSFWSSPREGRMLVSVTWRHFCPVPEATSEPQKAQGSQGRKALVS